MINGAGQPEVAETPGRPAADATRRIANATRHDANAAHQIAAVVLAAGASTRMGRNKLLLELNGETVARRAARTAIEAGLDPVIVVTGHAREAVEGELHGLRCRSVFNGEHANGTHTSVAAGIGVVERTASAAAIVMLADMPLVSAPMLRALVERYEESDAPLVASRYGGEVNAPPILYDRRLFGELRDMDARCGRQVVRRHRHEAVEVEWSAEAARDLDHPADYEWIRQALANDG
ncbi:MAG: nucleotidyltransferase family protein [Gemmatimonadota bacterium]|nr:nucleotidyltransferase family protein [Gemmatimonadota bacterium]